MTLKTISQIKADDARWKPASFDRDAIALASLAENRGRSVTLDHLRTLGMGDPDNPRPVSIGAIPRLMEALSVLYRLPAVRLLKERGGEVLADDDARAQAFAEMTRRALLDSVWGLVDARRNLLRQCFLSFVEGRRSVQARVHWPFDVFRSVTPSAADDLDQDEAIAIEVMRGPTANESVFQLWSHEEDDSWRCHIVNGAGALHGEQPYGDEGQPPYDGLPIVLVPDALMAGVAWLPIPESRLDFALNINTQVNDLMFIVKNQAHSLKVMTSNDPKGAKPVEDGPEKIMVLPEGSTLQVLQQSPAISAINDTIAAQLAMLAMSESLPGDAFSATRTVLTGTALKVAERDLEARRQRQVPITIEAERTAFEKMRAVHNAFASSWRVPSLGDELELVVAFASQWQPTDAREMQESAFKDMAIGATSIVGYLQERYRLDRAGAIDLYKRVQADRAAYPVANQQNPGAMIDGQLPAGGEGSATAADAKTPGAFNPDVATSTEGASVTSAVQAELAPGAASATPADADAAPAASASNALALEVGKASAVVDIAKAVGKGELERAAAVGLAQVLYGLSASEAERCMPAEPDAAKVASVQAPPTPAATG
jgi:hypothetical protein